MKYIGKKITSFTDLQTWKVAHQLVIAIYKIIKTFPSEEKYALIDQMRRCALSITSNIAEGFSRQSKKEKVQFYYTAKGSLTELQNQLLLARDIHYVTKESFSIIAQQTIQVSRLLTGLIKSVKNLS